MSLSQCVSTSPCWASPQEGVEKVEVRFPGGLWGIVCNVTMRMQRVGSGDQYDPSSQTRGKVAEGEQAAGLLEATPERTPRCRSTPSCESRPLVGQDAGDVPLRTHTPR